MFFKKKETKPLAIYLDESEMFRSELFQASKLSKKQYFEADSDYYTMLKQDGKFLGYPIHQGGKLFVFSPDPTKQGSRSEKNSYSTAKVTVIRKNLKFLVDWGTPPDSLYHIEDPITKEPYLVGANGIFEIMINPDDAARNATQLYREIFQEHNDYTTEDLKNRLRKKFLSKVGAGIEKMIIEEKRSLRNYVGLGPNALDKVSEQIFPIFKDIFVSYGLTITDFAISGLTVNKVI